MRRDRRFSLLVTGLLAVALLLSAAAWQSNPPRETVILAAPKEASPWPDEYSAQLSTVIALLQGTETPVPTATRPPYPTVTPRVLCTGGLSLGRICAVATLEPTPAPVRTVAPPTPIPTWPGEGKGTPGAIYQIGSAEGTP